MRDDAPIVPLVRYDDPLPPPKPNPPATMNDIENMKLEILQYKQAFTDLALLVRHLEAKEEERHAQLLAALAALNEGRQT